MPASNSNQSILEMRIALTTKEYDRLTNFYCQGLGIEPAEKWNNGQGQGLILNMGTATLEIVDQDQAFTIDQIEAGKQISGQIRFALQVPDLKTAMDRLLAKGARLVHPPVKPRGGITTSVFRTRMACRSPSFRVLIISSVSSLPKIPPPNTQSSDPRPDRVSEDY